MLCINCAIYLEYGLRTGLAIRTKKLATKKNDFGQKLVRKKRIIRPPELEVRKQKTTAWVQNSWVFIDNLCICVDFHEKSSKFLDYGKTVKFHSK